MGTMILLFIIIVILTNTLFLEVYYISSQKKKLNDYYLTIDAMDSDEYENRIADFVFMETESNMDIVVINTNGDLLYATNAKRRDKKRLENLSIISLPQDIFQNNSESPPPGNQPLNRPPQPPGEITRIEDITENVKLIWMRDPNFNHEVLLLAGKLGNGNLIEIAIPIASIKTNIKLSNEFLIFIGTAIFLLSLISVFFISRHFTNPIQEINDVTKRMKNLNFDVKCKIRTNDEIGQLAGSINDMSLELYNTIQSIKEKNDQLKGEINEKNLLAEKRRELLNNVSHELKTPLSYAGICGGS